ncbi:unnamed protein product [Brachionus calyciflorus]|uniref:GPI inositol-deacylase n=1 Tax=Brachionus calyciflorus TaxID=104777 RepID=A0A814FEC3_9BILA|nr:unnamed protein product [Brachionus calyciflorus]
MFLKHLGRIALCGIILLLIILGIIDYLKNFDQNECSMTYMRDYPQLIPIGFDTNDQFPNYKLYLYCEGYECQKYENLQFKEIGLVPVLFITGNADSHMQVRSLASVSLDKTKTKYPQTKLLYFTISFNEELSALYGPVIEKQTKFAKKSIEKILSLFSNIPENSRPKRVLIIGNSMGGIVARNLLIPVKGDNFNLNTVDTILTKSSPHVRPVINTDYKMSQIYEQINTYWLNASEKNLRNTILVSLYGGHRDILVRSGLSSIKNWYNKSNAKTISSFTPSTPYVWKSIDHRCMAWCRELIMTITRALFDLIDPRTKQIFESVSEREKVLRNHFEELSDETSIDKIALNGELIEKNDPGSIFFDLVEYDLKEQKVILFDLKVIIKNYDSLFIYSNINKKFSILACANFENSECIEPLDLIAKYAQTVPPLFENRGLTLKILNLNNLKDLLSEYSFIVLNLPVIKSNNKLILKLDWYNKAERYKSLSSNDLSEITIKTNQIFTRFFLTSISKIYQVYDVEKISKENSCDRILAKNKENFLSSCLMIQFFEPKFGHVINSESNQYKSKNISIKLTANTDENTTPYLDVIKFDPNHLVSDLSKINVDKDFVNEYRISIKFNFIGTLGQFIRFYITYFPAYLVCILQFYDYLYLTKKFEYNDDSIIFLDHYNSNLKSHLFLSISLICLNLLPKWLQSDFEILNNENVNFVILPFFLYWSAYVTLTILCFFVTLLSTIISFVIKKILLTFIPILKSDYFIRFLAAIHFIVSFAVGFFSWMLTLCLMFYAEFLTLIFNRQTLINQTSFLLKYILLVLNLPGLIVWTKSLSLNGIKPMSYFFEDCAQLCAIGILLIMIFTKAKSFPAINKINLNSNILSNLIFINLFSTIMYSTISLYRLQYFIIVHLFLMSLRKLDLEELDKMKKE